MPSQVRPRVGLALHAVIFAVDEGEPFDVAYLAKKLRVAESTARKRISELVKLGALLPSRRKGLWKPGCATLTVHSHYDDEPCPGCRTASLGGKGGAIEVFAVDGRREWTAPPEGALPTEQTTKPDGGVLARAYVRLRQKQSPDAPPVSRRSLKILAKTEKWLREQGVHPREFDRYVAEVGEALHRMTKGRLLYPSAKTLASEHFRDQFVAGLSPPKFESRDIDRILADGGFSDVHFEPAINLALRVRNGQPFHASERLTEAAYYLAGRLPEVRRYRTASS